MVIETCPRCGAVLMNTVIYTYSPIPCKNCPSKIVLPVDGVGKGNQSQLNIGRLEGGMD